MSIFFKKEKKQRMQWSKEKDIKMVASIFDGFDDWKVARIMGITVGAMRVRLNKIGTTFPLCQAAAQQGMCPRDYVENLRAYRPKQLPLLEQKPISRVYPVRVIEDKGDIVIHGTIPASIVKGLDTKDFGLWFVNQVEGVRA